MKLEEVISGFEELEEKDKAYLQICFVQSLLDSAEHRTEIAREKKASAARMNAMGIDCCEEYLEADKEYSLAIHIKELFKSQPKKLESEFYKTHIKKAA